MQSLTRSTFVAPYYSLIKPTYRVQVRRTPKLTFRTEGYLRCRAAWQLPLDTHCTAAVCWCQASQPDLTRNKQSCTWIGWSRPVSAGVARLGKSGDLSEEVRIRHRQLVPSNFWTKSARADRGSICRAADFNFQQHKYQFSFSELLVHPEISLAVGASTFATRTIVASAQ